MERRYIVQRIEWVTTGWKGPCFLRDKDKCEMKNAEEKVRKKSEKRGKSECKGCTEAWAFEKWEWQFNPENLAPNPEKLKKGDFILVISRYFKRNPNYYLVGVGVVKHYYKKEKKTVFIVSQLYQLPFLFQMVI